jgi:DNA polymerase-1
LPVPAEQQGRETGEEAVSAARGACRLPEPRSWPAEMAPQAAAEAGPEAAAEAGPEAAAEAGPESVEKTAVQVGLDLGRPVGVASEPGAGGSDAAARLWLAQQPAASRGPTGTAARRDAARGAAQGAVDYDSFVLVRATLEEAARSGLGRWLAGARVVCHDLKSQPALRGLVRQAAHDTYIGGYLLAPGRRDYRLSELAAEAGIPTPEGPPVGSRAAAASEYAACGEAAAALVLPVAAWQEEQLREQGMWELFQEIELPLTPVLVAMEEAGIHLDCYRLGEMAGKMQDQLEELETSIYDLAGETFNLGSPQQLARVLFEKLGLTRQRKTKTGYSTDAKTLEALRGSHPIVDLILNHRELSKLMSTYLLALPQAVDPRTGRLHTTFHQTVTATGRLSSSDPNLQNIPVRTALGAQIRQCFTAEPGHLLVVADYSQIELRIMAHLSGEKALLDSFARGEDIHARTAAEVFGLAEDQVDAVHRRYAKAVNFGIMYGISAFGLSQSLGIEREEAEAYIARYFERLPRVKVFIEETIAEARQRGYAATVFGRRRPIPELASGNFQERSLGERLAVNSVIQGSAADIIKVAMIRCYKRLQREFPSARLVLQVHDELVFEAPEGEAEAVRAAMVEEMVAAYPMEPPLGVDSGIGPDWLSAK